MPKNYFTGKEDDKARHAMIEQEAMKYLRQFVCEQIEQAIPLCISYNVMELKEGYGINDSKGKIDSAELVKRFMFTESFERFKRQIRN
jgi:hypothetical protein